MILENPATIAVVGGGPAGSFFTIQLLRKARQTKRNISVIILEKKKEIQFRGQVNNALYLEGCNYGVGGLSPRLVDIMDRSDLRIPKEILQAQVESLTIHGEWKNIELEIPEGRKMVSVFRGSRPQSRVDRFVNFDSFLISKAVKEGAKLIHAEVQKINYSSGQKPELSYKTYQEGKSVLKEMEADFVVFATGVNNAFSREISKAPLILSLKKVLPDFEPPLVRKSLICELKVAEKHLLPIKGEVHFAEFGSRDLKIEMSSLIPKNECITVAILGKSVDQATPIENFKLMHNFLAIPHIRRLLPKNLEPAPVCLCNPRMILKGSKKPYGDRIAIIGDLATARLYKDGIYSAYLTAEALAEGILTTGIDKNSLKKGYEPLLRKFKRDNRYGKFVFFLNRITFGTPFLSRIVYQAVLTEIRKKSKVKRRLDNILWKIASGDDDYKSIFLTMFHPATIWAIWGGGFFVTVRNTLAEVFFNLRWKGFGRFPTGIYKELFEQKRNRIFNYLKFQQKNRWEFESMYTIKIKAERESVFFQLGKFGDEDRKYFKPRFITVKRTLGNPNQKGSVVQYQVFSQKFHFNIHLEQVEENSFLIYRVVDGFAKGGILAFQLEDLKISVCSLSVYVGFNFYKGNHFFSSIFWFLFKQLFPGFLHNVVWNHSLCKLKDVIEFDS